VRALLVVGKPAHEIIYTFPAVTSLTTEQLTMNVEGDQVTTTEHWSDSVSDAAGVERYVVEATVTVEDGKVAQFDIRYDENDEQTRTYIEYVLSTPSVPFPGSTEFPLTGEQPATAYIAELDEVSFIEVHASAAASATAWTAEIRTGDCANPGASTQLADVLNGVSFTMLSTPLATFENTSAIHLSDQAGEVSCGAVPARTAAPAPTTVPPAPAPSPTATSGVTAPDAGSGREASVGEQWAFVFAIGVAAAGLMIVLAAGRMMSRRG
jgi:hypothetical protein